MRKSATTIKFLNGKLRHNFIIITDKLFPLFERDIINMCNRITSMCFMSFSDSSSTGVNTLICQKNELWSPKGWENYFSGNIVKHLDYIKNNNSPYETSFVKFGIQNDQASNRKNEQTCLDNINIRLTVKTIGTKLKQIFKCVIKLKDLHKNGKFFNLQWNNILCADRIVFLKNQMNSCTTFAGEEDRIRIFRVQNRPGDGFNPITVLKTRNRREVLYGEL